jgi:hypothetical protein
VHEVIWHGSATLTSSSGETRAASTFSDKLAFERSEILIPILDHLGADDETRFRSIQLSAASNTSEISEITYAAIFYSHVKTTGLRIGS